MTNSREVNTFSGRVKVSAYGVIHVSTVENPFSLKKKNYSIKIWAYRTLLQNLLK